MILADGLDDLHRDQAGCQEPRSREGSDKRCEGTKGRTRLHRVGRLGFARRRTSTPPGTVLLFVLAAGVEAPPGVKLACKSRKARQCEEESNPVYTHSRHLLSLEPEVLKRLGGAAVELRCATIFIPACGQVTLGNPGRRQLAAE